jgi:hypothetical protein
MVSGLEVVATTARRRPAGGGRRRSARSERTIEAVCSACVVVGALELS